ncbi:phage antirepressor KilAC domain-containing protein [Ancylobacter sp. IITR112]|uniref:phage antirepressor KilAC domain-containing protein n=1 Tax=Ancylobacter sp. IITR112 TaxID=3138073 RepID=UPI00352AE79D
MSTLEIADLLDKRHDHVMRDARKMLAELHGGDRLPNFGGVVERPNPSGGAPIKSPVLRLPKRETLILVSGYRLDLRARIIDRWLELEAAAAPPSAAFDPSDPLVVLAVVDHMRRQVTERDAIIAGQAEKVRHLARLEGAEGSMCLRDAAKTLNVRPTELISFLSMRRWIYKRPGNASWIGYQDKIQSGFLDHIDFLYRDDDGRDRVASRVHVTAKGLARIAEILSGPVR